MNHDEIYQKFIGNGKIQALNIIHDEETGEYVLRYKEGRKTSQISCEDRNFLEKLLVEFGGKNPETCRADDKFLILCGDWDSENINSLGHRITKIKIAGGRVARASIYPIAIPEGCGKESLVGSRRENPKNTINLQLKDREIAIKTLTFDSPREFDKMCDFILNDKALGQLMWHVMSLGTESRETGHHCVWKRVKAGDGTKRMALELITIDGNHYTECVRQDVFDAAGDMFYAPCQRIEVKKKREQTMEVCMFAAEEGAVDLEDYEPA